MTTTSPRPPATVSRSYLIPGFLVLAAVWGSSFLFIKVAVGELHPLYVTLGRVALGAASLLLILLVLRTRLPGDLRLWGHLAVLGTIGVAIPFTLFGYGEQHIPSALAGIWNATTPLVALPMAALVFRTESITARKVTGIAVGFVGVLVVLGVWQGVAGASLVGQLQCLGAAACYGIAVPYMKRFVADYPVSGLVLVAGQMICATALLTVVAPLAAGAPPAPHTLSAEVIGSMLALGVLGTGLVFLIHMRNIRLVGASAAALVTYLIPIFAVAAGVVVLGEQLSWYQPVGALIVLAGVTISQRLPVRWSRAPGPAVAPPVINVSPPTPAADQPARS
ncbi:DMT family transporter [Natronosporangium hydrolyticum]|uniref:DMT family transporter n=1 Tax=Natronosporangium hydrolyticum TaxID=2811111 RepID=A0A895YAU0_9ACTN|nr:DMT family transporter [Natronosporangium hydrolyticum]QSB14867.1 DMT family transporter [Natronosporangium hydrolyticum]